MPVFQRFESGNSFKVNATKATGKPLVRTASTSVGKHPSAHQRKSKAPVTLANIKLGEPK